MKENTDREKIRSFLESRVKPGHWHRSYKGTAFERQSNSTITNHARSNRVDSIMEKRLRPEEDAVNQETFEHRLSPEIATHKLVARMVEHFEKSLDLFKSVRPISSVLWSSASKSLLCPTGRWPSFKKSKSF